MLVVEALPLASVTVYVTVFDPTLAQVNDVLLNTLVEIEQLSVDPFSTSLTDKVTFPVASNVNVNGVFALITGAVLS
jgi:hypothetical protein